MADTKVGKLIYEIDAETGGIGSKLKEAESLVKSFSQKVSESLNSQAGSVFKGLASYDALKEGVRTVTDFLKESVMASMEASKTMALVEQNVKNAGASYDEIGPKLDAYREKTIAMGFDDEDTAESVSRLMLVTKDYDQALKLNQLSMDLARNKNIDLKTATMLVTQVTQGNNRVLKQYGIELNDSATAADNLTTLQGKVADSAKVFADTTAGKLEIMKVKWGNIKEEVGDQLLPVLIDTFGTVEDNLPAITDFLVKMAKAVSLVGSTSLVVLNGLLGLGKAVKGTIQLGVEGGINIVQGAQKGLQELGYVSEDTVKKTGQLSKAMDDLAKESFNSAIDNGDNVKKSFDSMAKTLGLVEEETKKAGNTADKTKVSFASIGVGASDAESKLAKARQEAEKQVKTFQDMQKSILDTRNAVKELGDSLGKELTDKFKDFNKELKDQVAEGKKSLADITITAEKEIKDLRTKISEANQKASEDMAGVTGDNAGDRINDIIKNRDREIAEYQKTIDEKQKIITASGNFETTFKTTLADKEKQITDLQTKQTAEIDPAKKAGLEIEIKARQTALDQIKSLGDYQKTLAEERKLADMDEFTRTMTDIMNKINARTEEFVTEVVQLKQKQLIANEVEADITKFLQSQTAVRQATIDAFAKTTIAKLQSIGSEARSALSALNSVMSIQSQAGVALPTAPKAPSKASGGFTVGGEMVHSGEYVIPRWQTQAMRGLVDNLEAMRTGQGSGAVTAPVINVNVDKLDSELDVRAIGRELVFELGNL